MKDDKKKPSKYNGNEKMIMIFAALFMVFLFLCIGIAISNGIASLE